jgi:hypothetical protein
VTLPQGSARRRRTSGLDPGRCSWLAHWGVWRLAELHRDMDRPARRAEGRPEGAGARELFKCPAATSPTPIISTMTPDSSGPDDRSDSRRKD